MAKKDRSPKQAHIDNILSAYYRASPEDIADGLSWYARAGTWAADIAGRYRLPARTVVGVLAALSPMVSWDKNLEDCEHVIRYADNRAAVRVHTYRANLLKAWAILDGLDPACGLGKFKTLDFFRCIIEDDAARPVCVDRHAAAVCFGRPLSDVERSKVSGPLYDTIANAYRAAAAIVKLRPYELQAMVWVYWRKIPINERG